MKRSEGPLLWHLNRRCICSYFEEFFSGSCWKVENEMGGAAERRGGGQLEE